MKLGLTPGHGPGIAQRMALLAGLVGAAWIIPAWAAGDYYLKIEGIKGELQATADHDHKGWIEIQSLSFKGGVSVAAGDVSGDARAPARPSTGRITAAPVEPEQVGLLLPAVQKVRSAAARTAAWPGCRPGQRLSDVTMREGQNGPLVRVLDATVTRCARDQVTFTFSRVR